MIDPDRPFRDQDPLDQNARSGAEGSGVGAWDIELSTRKLSWSTATRKLFGVGPDAPVDYDLFLSLLDAQDRDRTARAMQASIDTGCNFDVQCRVYRHSDERHWVRAVGTAINGPDGAPARLSGLSINRTIIETHGGRMWAETNRSGGATFRFTLPAAHAKE